MSASNYLNKIPPPANGERNSKLNQTAYAVRERFPNQDRLDFEVELLQWCRSWPSPLSDAEAMRTIKSAWQGAESKGVVGSKQRTYDRPSAGQNYRASCPPVQHQTPPSVKPAEYEEPEARILPCPMEDGTRKLLNAAFEEGEGVRICMAVLDEERKERPTDEGSVLSREEWISKLTQWGGDPNAIFYNRENAGIYITVNPMKVGGSKDADVTAYRHALLEFDDISREEQWHIIRESRVPCTAVIDSGGKSIHAWVKVNAKDIAEFRERVSQLYQHFANYKPDAKNKNPSRFSRLPNCVRFDKRQELIGLNVGAEDWLQWASELQMEGEGEPLKVSTLLEYAGKEDPNNIIGQRYLCRGGSVILVGQSGIGKSSLTAQFALSWACGRDVFGIRPVKPLKILVIQAENDDGDLAEMTAGVLNGMGVKQDSEEFQTINRNLIFIRDTVETGFAFTERVRRLVDRYRPDVVFLDPLLSFIGADISRQEVCSQFLRNWLNPISEQSGCIWFAIHHTGKPSSDPKARQGWNDSDWAYAGMGSSELTNWARAVMVLRDVGQGHFKLTMAKRGNRAGATHLDGQPTSSIWLKHASEGICWIQVEEPEMPSPKDKDKASGRKEVDLPLGPVIDRLTTAKSKNALAKEIVEYAEDHGVEMSLSTAKRRVVKLLGNKAIKRSGEGFIRA